MAQMFHQLLISGKLLNDNVTMKDNWENAAHQPTDLEWFVSSDILNCLCLETWPRIRARPTVIIRSKTITVKTMTVKILLHPCRQSLLLRRLLETSGYFSFCFTNIVKSRHMLWMQLFVCECLVLSTVVSWGLLDSNTAATVFLTSYCSVNSRHLMLNTTELYECMSEKHAIVTKFSVLLKVRKWHLQK